MARVALGMADGAHPVAEPVGQLPRVQKSGERQWE